MNMVQYGVWSNCCNACSFCLREERIPYSKEKQLKSLNFIKENIKTIDWENKFSYGVSLLGGELYYITDKELQDAFMELIETIIQYVLKVSKNPICKYSTVTNGIYDPAFLYRVIDRIVEEVGIGKVDVNFSYDLKYRYKDEATANLVLQNIKEFGKRYNYKTGVQMILTQYVINEWKKKQFKVSEFIQEKLGGNASLAFLYPHPIATGIKLKDFFFNRSDLFEFLLDLKTDCYNSYYSFMMSTKNSCVFKYTGGKNKTFTDTNEEPVLADGKEIINPNCGHSTLYQCYADTDDCLLCDLELFDEELLL